MPEDYKTPYLYSEKNIRYHKPVDSLTKEPDTAFFGDGVGVGVLDK